MTNARILGDLALAFADRGTDGGQGSYRNASASRTTLLWRRGFMRHIETNVPDKLGIHLVVGNYATHKHPRVRDWPARRPRWHLRVTPTYAPWLNKVERFFALITQRAITSWLLRLHR